MTGPVALSQREIVEYAIWGAGCYEDDFIALVSYEKSRVRPRKAQLKKYEARLELIRLDIKALNGELSRLKKEASLNDSVPDLDGFDSAL